MPAWTRAGLRAAGIDAAELQRRLRRRELVRVGRDRYAPLGPVAADALVAPAGSGLALRGLSAARAWALPAADGMVEAQVREGCRRTSLPVRAAVRRARRWDVVERDGLSVTGLAQTCADVAREQPLEVSVPALDAALRQGLEPAEVLERLGRGVAGATAARRALSLADARAESPLESRLRLLLVLGGVPPLDLQHVVLDADGRFVARVDLWYRGLVVEADGYEFHRGREDYRRDRDKGVEYARLGLLSQRFSWERVVGQQAWVLGAVRDASSYAAPTLAERPRRRRLAARTPSAARTASVGAA